MASSRHGRSSALVIATVVIVNIAMWVQLTEAQHCHREKPLVNDDFEITCGYLEIDFEIVCKTRRPGAWSNLPSHSYEPNSVTRVSFRNCSFPHGLSLLNVTKALGATPNFALQIEQARTLLRREHLAGFRLNYFFLTNSNFDLDGESDGQLPRDLLYDLQTSVMIFDNLTLTHVPSDFFKGASQLGVLQIKNMDGLRRLGYNDFTALKNLEELNLNDNAIEEIESSSFEQLENLRDLKIVGNRLHTLPPDIFRRLVHLKNLDLSGNVFDELPGDLIRINGSKLERVLFSNNRGSMRSLPPEFFRNLSKLNYVELDGNGFTSIPGDVLLGTRSLEILDIRRNNLTSLPAGLFEDTGLVEFWASKNQLTSLSKGLFANINLERLYLNYNLLSNITRHDFSDLNNLLTLELRHNNLRYIEPQSCKNWIRVQYIDLSYNQLGLLDREIQDADSLLVLLDCFYNDKLNMTWDISNLHKIRMNGINLSWLNLEGNRFTHLNIKHLQLLNPGVTLNLDNNNITTVDLEDLKPVAYDNRNKLKIEMTTRVSLENNSLHCDCQLRNFFRYFKGKLDQKVYDFIKIEPKEHKCASPPQLQGKLINTIPSEELRCPLTDNETTSDDACNRNCTCWRTPGKKLLSVDCSYRNLTSVPPMVCNPYNFSIELNMSGNHLRTTPSMNGFYLANVTTLDLSFNNISQVTPDLFSSALRVLKLHNNSISRLADHILQLLYDDDLLTNLTLHGNPYICDCQTRNMLNFVQKKIVAFELHAVTCRENNRRLYEVTNNELCEDMIKIIIFVAFFCAGCIAILSILTVFYFKYVMEIKIWLYSKQWCLWFVTEDELDKDKLYDAFISFSHKDEDFVEKKIVAKLEEGPMPYKLCLHHRDWLAGEWIPVRIARSVEESRRTIIIMSPNFLESVWGKIEFRTAHNQTITEGRARVIVVLYRDIGDTEELDPELKDYLSMNTYLKWGDPWFWDRLRYALPHRHELSKKKRRSRNVRTIENHMTQLASNNRHRNNEDDIIPMSTISTLLESNAEC